jgi:hypothetical protein
MSEGLHQLVRDRAGNRCEYCHIRQEAEPFLAFHIEHIVPRQHGGADDESNRALACQHCNLHKGPNLTSIDPLTAAVVPLFNPRSHRWTEHFALHGRRVVGLTAVGRATMRLLRMTADSRLQLREGA